MRAYWKIRLEKKISLIYNVPMSEEQIKLIVNIAFIAIAVFAVVISVFAMQKVRKLKSNYKAAIILIPLTYNKIWEVVAVLLFAVLALASIVGMILTKEYIIFAAVLVVIISLCWLMIKMMTCRFAVLDSGIVTPFRYIDWLHLYDYRIEGNKVFFFRDAEGYDTIRAISPRLSFDEANRGKLEFLLTKNKVKND